jgi:hypothetical protein
LRYANGARVSSRTTVAFTVSQERLVKLLRRGARERQALMRELYPRLKPKTSRWKVAGSALNNQLARLITRRVAQRIERGVYALK